MNHPMLTLLADELPGESARHQAEHATPREVWQAQVDHFAAHLVQRVVEGVLAPEIRAALHAEPNTICLHKALAALSTAAEYLDQLSSGLVQALVAAEDSEGAD